MQHKDEVQEQAAATLDRIEQFGNSSEETRAAALEAMGRLTLALAINELAKGIKESNTSTLNKLSSSIAGSENG